MCSQIEQLFVDVLIYFYSRDVLKLPHCICIFSSFISIAWHIQRKEQMCERKLCCGHWHLKKKPSSSGWELQGSSTIVG